LATSAAIQNKPNKTEVTTAPRPMNGIDPEFPNHRATSEVARIVNKMATTTTTHSLMKICELIDLFFKTFGTRFLFKLSVLPINRQDF
jgi:hypothetical protein